MITQKTWKEFKESGLFWLVNQTLHLFGWAIVMQIEDDGNISSVYPARVKFRGFDEKTNNNGYKKVSKYLLENIEELEKETRE